MAPTYLLYTDHYDTLKANLYVEMGQVHAVPSKGDRVVINGTTYKVTAVVWDVYTEPPNPSMKSQYPQQNATVVVE